MKEIACNCGIFDRVRSGSFRHGDNQHQQDGRHEKDRAKRHDESVDRFVPPPDTLGVEVRNLGNTKLRGYGYMIDWIYERNGKLT